MHQSATSQQPRTTATDTHHPDGADTFPDLLRILGAAVTDLAETWYTHPPTVRRELAKAIGDFAADLHRIGVRL